MRKITVLDFCSRIGIASDEIPVVVKAGINIVGRYRSLYKLTAQAMPDLLEAKVQSVTSTREEVILQITFKDFRAWARENAKSSGLEAVPIRWIVDDCAKFVEREIRRGKRYDAIIMDPPSYGRGPSGEIWKLEHDLYPFVELVSGVLSDEPLFVIINSYTTGLAPSVLGYLLDSVLGRRFRGHSECDELGLPVTDSGLTLPCGSAGRWVAD